MIILTIDEKNKKLKLTSLARDTLVDIKIYSEEKLTHEYFIWMSFFAIRNHK